MLRATERRPYPRVGLKVYFPNGDITKGDVVDYYGDTADHLLRHAKGRPLTLQRFPDGIEGDGSYQKRVPDQFPSWIGLVEVSLEGGGSQEQVTAADTATLA